MIGDVIDRAPDFVQHCFGASVSGVETTKEMRHLGQTNSGMIDDPRFQQLIHAYGRAALENVDINTGVE